MYSAYWLLAILQILQITNKMITKGKNSLIFYQIPLLWNSQNREHQKYLWNAIASREISQ